MKKLLSILGLVAIGTSAIASPAILTSSNNQNTNLRSLEINKQDISVGNNSVVGMDNARYFTHDINNLFNTYISEETISILKANGINVDWVDGMFDQVSLTNMETGNAITDNDTTSFGKGAHTLWINVILKTNEKSETMGLTGEMNFTYYMNFAPLNLNDSVLSNFVLDSSFTGNWSAINTLERIILQSDVWIYEQVATTTDILYTSPYAQSRIDHKTLRPIYIEETNKQFTQDMLDNMEHGEQINLKYSYFATENGRKEGIYGSTMVHITFTKNITA